MFMTKFQTMNLESKCHGAYCALCGSEPDVIIRFRSIHDCPISGHGRVDYIMLNLRFIDIAGTQYLVLEYFLCNHSGHTIT